MSAYKINKETTNVKTGAKPLSYSEVNPVKYVNEKIVYGPYENNKPFVKVILILNNKLLAKIFLINAFYFVKNY